MNKSVGQFETGRADFAPTPPGPRRCKSASSGARQ